MTESLSHIPTSITGGPAVYGGLNPEFVRRAQRNNRLRIEAERREAERRAEQERRKREKAEQRSAEAVAAYRVIEITRPVQEVAKPLDQIDIAKHQALRHPTKSIIAAIAAAHGMTPDMLLGPRRKKSIVAARQEAMAKVATLRPDMSLPMIGKAFGGKDHTTVLHAIQKMGVWPRQSVEGRAA